MANALKQEDRLDDLAAKVKKLRVEVVDLEREAGELLDAGLLLDGEAAGVTASARADASRMLLKAALDLYFDEVEAQRSTRCPVHGEALLVCCPDCAARNPAVRAAHASYLASVRISEAAAE